MDVVFALASVYLALAWNAAREVVVDGEGQDFAGQLRIAAAVLAAGLCWPQDYWRRLKEDWDNHFVDD